MPNTPPSPPPPPKPPRPPMTDAELTALSAITSSDIDRARGAWESDAPPPFRHLLEAKDDGTGTEGGAQ